MKKNKRILKRNNFKASIPLVFIVLLLSLISYVILPSENEILIVFKQIQLSKQIATLKLLIYQHILVKWLLA